MIPSLVSIAESPLKPVAISRTELRLICNNSFISLLDERSRSGGRCCSLILAVSY